MYRFFIMSLCFIAMGCNSERTQQHIAKVNSTINYAQNDAKVGTFIPSEPYDLILKLKKHEEGLYAFDIYTFEAAMYLFEDAHYISPNAVRDFSGKFTLHIDASEALTPIDDLIETPRSVEEIDKHPFTDGAVNWVRKNTKYHQKLQRNTNENFEVKGFIQFTIEPRCTLEKIPFVIRNIGGELRIGEFGC